jgi:hypothetical protein
MRVEPFQLTGFITLSHIDRSAAEKKSHYPILLQFSYLFSYNISLPMLVCMKKKNFFVYSIPMLAYIFLEIGYIWVPVNTRYPIGLGLDFTRTRKNGFRVPAMGSGMDSGNPYPTLPIAIPNIGWPCDEDEGVWVSSEMIGFRLRCLGFVWDGWNLEGFVRLG